MLFGVRHSDEVDAEDAALAPGLCNVEQRAERRIAVEAREAAPDNVATSVDEQADGAVADQRQIERASDHGSPPSSDGCRNSCASQ